MFQDCLLLHILFNVSRLLSISFGWIFQDFSSLTYTKNSLHFHLPFLLLLIYIHMPIALYTISSQIHSDQKRYICIQSFNDTYITLTLQFNLILTPMSRLWPRKGACFFYSLTVSYGFDVEVGRYGFCESYDSLWVFGCLRFWFGKVINVFCFKAKEN